MILKKPYAFLIKYFKLINLALAIFTLFIAYRYYHIINFFSEYIANNYTGNYYPGFYQEYFSLFFYLAIILTILGIGGILLLFIYKKKPNKDYLLAISFYILFFIGLMFIKNVMISLETVSISAEESRLYRDITLIGLIPQIPFIILFFLRGFGLNYDKFNFKQDIKDLEIASEDSEEIEITFKGDAVKLKRNIRRFFREFTYYIKENKFIFTIICLILVIFIGIQIKNILPSNVNQKYRQGDYFTSLGLKYRIEDSILTNIDYKGDIIKKDYYYLVAKLYVENNKDESVKIDYNRFRLEIGDNLIYPTINKGIYFIDYAKNNTGLSIAKKSSTVYSLIYEIDKKYVKKNYRIQVDAGITLDRKELVGKSNFIDISPLIIDTVNEEGNYKLDSNISFKSSNLKNTKMQLSNLEITDKYIYKYEFCTKYNSCDTYTGQVNINNLKNKTTLMVMDYEYNIDKSIPFYTSNSNITNLINTFGKIRYLLNQRDYYASVEVVTPSNLQDKLVLETTNEIKDADEVVLIITVRNKEYLIKLK